MTTFATETITIAKSLQEHNFDRLREVRSAIEGLRAIESGIKNDIIRDGNPGVDNAISDGSYYTYSPVSRINGPAVIKNLRENNHPVLLRRVTKPVLDMTLAKTDPSKIVREIVLSHTTSQNEQRIVLK